MLSLSATSWLDLADYRFYSQLEDSTDLSDVYILSDLEEIPFHFNSNCLWVFFFTSMKLKSLQN